MDDEDLIQGRISDSTIDFIYRKTIIFLGIALVLVIIAITFLIGLGKTAPDGLIAIGSAAVGAMAGLLAPISSTNKPVHQDLTQIKCYETCYLEIMRSRIGGYTYLIPLVLLGIVTITVVIAITYLSCRCDIPEGLIAIGSTAVGAMSGIVMPRPEYKAEDENKKDIINNKKIQ